MGDPVGVDDPRVSSVTVRMSDALRARFVEQPTIQIAPDTIDPGSRQVAEALLADLARRARGAEALSMDRVLGEGGMGVVHLAEQRSLGRRVAVKAIKSEAWTVTLLREAWCTGQLEHPNIIPVHEIELDAEGLPLIVMKNIEGVDWARLMFDAEEVARVAGDDDLLEFNLRTLMAVCRAIHFAHSRRIIHRDIKPENVMIGAHGEVYVVDWGIALSLDPDPTGRLPTASTDEGIVGTPCYMAPEMVEGAGLSERTDVYLLGSVLFELLTGEPPHQGATLPQLVANILAPDPPVAEGAPRPLAELCQQAMSPDPDERPASAELFRQAIQRYLEHRGALRLVDRAEQNVEQLWRLIDPSTPAVQEESRDRALYKVFGECRFAFRQALEAWPESSRAREGLRGAVRAVARWELARDNPDAAASVLADLDEPMADLEEAILEAQDAKAAERQRMVSLQRLHKDLDPRRGARLRTLLIGACAVALGAAPWITADGAWLLSAFWGALLGVACTLTIAYIARRAMLASRINRQVVTAFVVYFVMSALVTGVGALAGWPEHPTMSLLLLIASAVCAMLLDRRTWTWFLPSAITSLVAFVVTALEPSTLRLAFTIATVVGFASAMWVSSRYREADDEPPSSI